MSVALILSAVLAVAIGFAFLCATWPPAVDFRPYRAVVTALASGVGLGITAVGLFGWLVLFGPPDRALMAVELAVLILVVGWINRAKRVASSSLRHGEDRASGLRPGRPDRRHGIRGDAGVRRRGVRWPVCLPTPRGLGCLDELEPPGQDDLSRRAGVAGGVLASDPLVASGLPDARAGIRGADLDLRRR